MPKVTVQHPKIDGPDTEVSVRWVKDSFVQLYLERHPHSRTSPDNPNVVLQGEPVRECPNGCNGTTEGCSACPSPDSADLTGSVWSEPMSRDEVNNLIRTLRRARDQVFGADE